MFKKGRPTETSQRFTIRKYHFGAASVLLGTFFALGTGVASANETASTQPSATAPVVEKTPVATPQLAATAPVTTPAAPAPAETPATQTTPAPVVEKAPEAASVTTTAQPAVTEAKSAEETAKPRSRRSVDAE
ncbi:MAG: YSIRK-type signal peptide-containing protein, partial [Gemella sp.]|nr:YSIRK-type signal peptide-containing protein [Gemella sp.]